MSFSSDISKNQGYLSLSVTWRTISIGVVESGRPRMLALLVPQAVEAGVSTEGYLTSADTVEEFTGMDFFSGLEDSLESVIPARMW